MSNFTTPPQRATFAVLGLLLLVLIGLAIYTSHHKKTVATKTATPTATTAMHSPTPSGSTPTPPADIKYVNIPATPIPSQLVAVVKAQSDLSTFSKWLADSSASSQYGTDFMSTVFAPNDNAIAKMDPSELTYLNTAGNTSGHTSYISAHTVGGAYATSDLKDGQKLTSQVSSMLTITKKGSDTYVNGFKIIKADIPVGKGYLNIVDGNL